MPFVKGDSTAAMTERDARLVSRADEGLGRVGKIGRCETWAPQANERQTSGTEGLTRQESFQGEPDVRGGRRGGERGNEGRGRRRRADRGHLRILNARETEVADLKGREGSGE